MSTVATLERAMRRLSSHLTVFYKRVLPFIWLIFPVIWVFLWWNGAVHGDQRVSLFSFLPLLVVFVVGLVLFKKLIADLMDEVWLEGDRLLVKNRAEQTGIALTDVINVNATSMTNPRRVTLMLRVDSRFGRHITFIPASPRGFLAAFRMDPIAVELIERIDALRQARR
jgi:hypothetical protein